MSRRADKAVFKVSELLKPRYRAPNKSLQQQQQQQQQQGAPSIPQKLPPAFPKKRGRPFKNAATAAAAAAKKAAKAAAAAAVAAANGGDPSEQSQSPSGSRKRGRPCKSPHPEASAEHFPHQDRLKRTKQLRRDDEAEEEYDEVDEEEEEDAGDGYYKEDIGPLSGAEVLGDESFEGRRMELLRWRMSLMAMMKSLEVAEANLARDMAAAAEGGGPDA